MEIVRRFRRERPLLLRATDPSLMVSLTDVTELHWT